ncbi:nucleoside diphosphate kinase [candidate division MSBL1 archaeon SCGC-AAA261G05]|uniref:Nucleoside diphosphate kinase n=3 Tax=candidate division MSBL1 TaxID=215777 RepID=A0A133V279_9EURY|nr:nucleoside diphosphate kinase [candidate division MSBL1 archaeon SCGC-AAA261C02]KXB04027.1 nucleoside diphosphate kinase [candidate division MSBL1 archaeon SCGC-AAA261G05]KXB04694.1 nucleoside diphosphate kinase [candidate division MSBL1 archaeon SCGC-AAA261O19]
MTERTFVMIKPDGVKKGLTDEIASRIRESNLKIIEMKQMELDRETAEELYSVHEGKEFFEKLVKHVTAGPVIPMLVEGDNAIKRMREIIGATNPEEAEEGTIRADFGSDITNNIIHSADSPESFKREARIFFSEDQI